MDKEQAKKRKKKLKKELKELSSIINKRESDGNIENRVKTFEDACKIKKIDPKKYIPYLKPKTSAEKALNAIAKLWIIIEVINEGLVDDYSDTDKIKWFPYFEKNRSGFGFSNTAYSHWNANTGAGSRFALKTEKKARYIGTQFLDLYNEFL